MRCFRLRSYSRNIKFWSGLTVAAHACAERLVCGPLTTQRRALRGHRARPARPPPVSCHKVLRALPPRIPRISKSGRSRRAYPPRRGSGAPPAYSGAQGVITPNPIGALLLTREVDRFARRSQPQWPAGLLRCGTHSACEMDKLFVMHIYTNATREYGVPFAVPYMLHCSHPRSPVPAHPFPH